MSITRIEYAVFKRLRDLDALPLGSSVLDVHGTKWQGDVPIQELGQDIYAYAKKERRKQLFLDLDCLAKTNPATLPVDLAEIWYEAFFHVKPTPLLQFYPNESKPNLNVAHQLPSRFDCIIDLGTAGQVFNVYQYFKNIHDWTDQGGLMIHRVPLSGWQDQTLYHFCPTFFWDLAAANGYTNILFIHALRDGTSLQQMNDREQTVSYFSGTGIAENSLIYSFAVKENLSEFQIP